jgi:septal ring factor EnvC (AmiA/AmiB activator)
MARKKTISSIDSEIVKTQEMLAKAKSRYDSLAKELKALRDKKWTNFGKFTYKYICVNLRFHPRFKKI